MSFGVKAGLAENIIGAAVEKRSSFDFVVVVLSFRYTARTEATRRVKTF